MNFIPQGGAIYFVLFHFEFLEYNQIIYTLLNRDIKVKLVFAPNHPTELLTSYFLEFFVKIKSGNVLFINRVRFRFPPALNYGDPSDSPTALISDLDMKKMLEKS